MPAWQETPFFTERKRAEVLWTEKLTLISLDYVPDEVYERVHPHFADDVVIRRHQPVARRRRWGDLSGHLLRFLVELMTIAARAVLLPLDALRMEALVLGGEVVAVFAVLAGENDFVAWHTTIR